LVIGAAELVLMAAAALIGALVVVGIIGIDAAFLPETAFRVALAALQSIHAAILGQQHVLGRQLGRLQIDIMPNGIPGKCQKRNCGQDENNGFDLAASIVCNS
jgi:hypothetical protein